MRYTTILFLVLLSNSTVCADQLTEILDVVKRNQRLYEFIGCEIEVTEKTFPKKKGEEKAGAAVFTCKDKYSLLQYKSHYRTQVESESGTKDKFLVRQLRLESYGADNRSRQYTEVNRIEEKKPATRKTGRISRGRQRPTNLIRPHMMFFVHGQQTTLENFIQGRDARRETRFSNYCVEPRFDGIEKVDGLVCIKLRVESKRFDHLSSVWELWLARDRNYIPVKAEHYIVGISTELPCERSVVTEWMEIQPGVWFPSKAKTVMYDQDKLPDGQRLLAFERAFSVTNVRLNPNVRSDSFRIKFPADAIIFDET